MAVFKIKRILSEKSFSKKRGAKRVNRVPPQPQGNMKQKRAQQTQNRNKQVPPITNNNQPTPQPQPQVNTGNNNNNNNVINPQPQSTNTTQTQTQTQQNTSNTDTNGNNNNNNNSTINPNNVVVGQQPTGQQGTTGNVDWGKLGKSAFNKVGKPVLVGAGILGAAALGAATWGAKKASKSISQAAENMEDRLDENRRWRREKKMADKLIKAGYNPYAEGQRIGGYSFTRPH